MTRPLILILILIAVSALYSKSFRWRFYNSRSVAKIQLIDTEKPVSKFIPKFDHGNRSQKKIALTFDADMTPAMVKQLKTGKVKTWYNQKIVDILEDEKVPATIFMAGMWVEQYPDIARSLAQNPLFEIANHSYSHPRFTPACFALPPVPSWGKEGEFQKSQAVIAKVTGVIPKFFRFPGGCQTPSDIEMANRHGLMVVGWDAASTDSFNNNYQAVLNSVKTKTQNGSIVLFHFHGNKNAPQTANVLRPAIQFLRARGFEFVKLSDLVNNMN